MCSAPRYLPDRPFPPYTYVPGQAPHPIRDPAGHMYGREPATPELQVDRWWDCEEYLWGVDLFNHGYYWEAHEAWEGLWHAAERQGPVADFLKGLIKLTAAGVKTREGSAEGRRRHLRRAIELFTSVREGSHEDVMGLSMAILLASLHTIEEETAVITSTDSEPPRAFRFVLDVRETNPR